MKKYLLGLLCFVLVMGIGTCVYAANLDTYVPSVQSSTSATTTKDSETTKNKQSTVSAAASVSKKNTAKTSPDTGADFSGGVLSLSAFVVLAGSYILISQAKKAKKA